MQGIIFTLNHIPYGLTHPEVLLAKVVTLFLPAKMLLLMQQRVAKSLLHSPNYRRILNV